MKFQCPGSSQQNWKPEDIFEAACPVCDNLIEFWKDDPLRKCDVCGEDIPNPKLDLGCAKWCKFSKDCLPLMSGKDSSDINRMAEALKEALQKARNALRQKPLERILECSGLSPNERNQLPIPLFNQTALLNLSTFEFDPGQDEIHPQEQILLMRSLDSERRAEPTHEWISFRDFQGGVFYHGSAEARTGGLLLKVTGGCLDLIKTALDKFPHQPGSHGDFSAAVDTINHIPILLICREADEEFPAAIDLLYDKALAILFHTDEVAALAHRLCLRLLRSLPSKTV